MSVARKHKDMVADTAASAVRQPEPPPALLGDAAAFLCDDQTAEIASGVFQEQGLHASIRTGGIKAAIEELPGRPSPRLIVVDLSDSTTPMGDIDRLAEVCDPGTSVIALGTANDVTLFRDLLASGVTDYLIKPITNEALGEALVAASARVDAASDGGRVGRLVAFIGSRGGVGCSSVALNVANIIAEEQGQRVALVDLDLQFGTTAMALDIEAGHGLREALENPARIDSLFVSSAAVSIGRNLFVLASEEPLDGSVAIDNEAVDLLFGELRNNFGCVVVDVPRHAAVANWHMLVGASTIVIVSDLSLLGMRDTMRLVAMARNAVPGAKVLVVANRAGHDKKEEISKQDFEKSGEVKIDYVVPDDSKLFTQASHSGKPILAFAKGAKVTGALRDLCSGLVGEKEQARRQSFWKRMGKG